MYDYLTPRPSTRFMLGRLSQHTRGEGRRRMMLEHEMWTHDGREPEPQKLGVACSHYSCSGG
jgi:hypothetical protein